MNSALGAVSANQQFSGGTRPESGREQPNSAAGLPRYVAHTSSSGGPLLGHTFSILNSCPSKSHHCSVFFQRSSVEQGGDAPFSAAVRLRRLCFTHRRIFSRVRRELVTTSFASVRCNLHKSERLGDQHAAATDRWNTSECTGLHTNAAHARDGCLHYGHE